MRQTYREQSGGTGRRKGRLSLSLMGQTQDTRVVLSPIKLPTVPVMTWSPPASPTSLERRVLVWCVGAFGVTAQEQLMTKD